MSVPWRSVARVLQAVVVTAVLVASVAVLWANTDGSRLVATILHARAAPLALAAAMVLPAAVSRSAYWAAMLAPLERVGFRLLVGYTIACNAANVLLPARAGDAMRAWLLRTRHGVPLRTSAAAVAIEKVGDLLALSVFVAPLLWLLPAPTPMTHRALQILLAIVVAVAFVVAVALRYADRVRWLAGVRELATPIALRRGFAAIALCWLVDLVAMLLVMSAVGLPVRLGSALLVLLFVNLATAIPASPGQLGTHELASAAAMRMQGALPEEAVAFALLYHFAQLLPVLLLGLFDLRTTLRWRRAVAAGAAAGTDLRT